MGIGNIMSFQRLYGMVSTRSQTSDVENSGIAGWVRCKPDKQNRVSYRVVCSISRSCVNSLDIHDGLIIRSYLMNESVNVNNIKSILKYERTQG